ncbi:sensor histidine kinase [Natrialbaceae archaeon A-gly3]
MVSGDALEILLIEDNAGDVRLIEKRLERADPTLLAADYHLECAPDLSSGLAHLESVAVDVVLLDLGLPDSVGLDSLERTLECAPDVPIVVLTGRSDRKMAVDAITQGAQDYLTKDDLTGRELARAIRYAVERKRKERELEVERDFLDEIVESLPYPFYVLDIEEYTIERANSRAAVEEGETCHEVTHGRDRPCNESDDPVACPIVDVRETGEPTTVEHIHYDENGDERIYEVHAAPIVDDDGTVTRMAESNIDVTERIEYQRRLEDQRDDLEILNEVVRHDIRNDLQLIEAYAEMLEDHVDPEGEEYLEIVRESANNAVDLTTTARDLAEVMLQTDVENHQVSLRRTLEGQLEDVRSTKTEAEIVLEGSIPDVDVVGNDMLGAVFGNLLTNAIQHNDSDVPEVTVSASERDGGDVIEVRVADNGPGVPDAQKEEVFGKGEKGLESEGTGLGLYLVKSLVESYGGNVWVEDRLVDGERAGAVFVVQLPIAE